MTLDEAIKHAEEVAEKNEKQASWFFGKEGNPNYENCVECAEEHKQLAEWLKELKQLREQTRWIPVSERLPKKSGRYIVSVLDGINRRTTVVKYQSRYKTWTMTGRMAYWKVVAWGPLLPEPYKAESEE